MMSDRRRVGVIVPPRYFDTSARELTALAPQVDVLHTQMRLGDDFDYSLDQIVRTGGEVEACARSLAEAGAEVVVQLGTPFSTAHGWRAGVDLESRIADATGTPLVMMGLSVPAGVHHLGGRQVAMATTYYGPAWIERYTAFATEAGLEVLGQASFVDQGHYPDHDASWSASFGVLDPDLVAESLTAAAADHPRADALLVPGMPGPILPMVPEIEAAIGRPVVSYFAAWWRCLRHLGIEVGDSAGRLLATV